ncbi:MAG TPA: metalloregulator ArsR/SmtB family transcription factor [Verrucomicrobiae bacterium]|nr:metalloregulator ArsR/SmtB family transcription factor [Verrucomicrobiae bacterium]
MRDAQCRPARLQSGDFTKQAGLFKVLADPHRLKIFATIAQARGEVCVCDITAALPLEQPTVSHHLRVLRECGLLLSERRATWVYYRLTPGAIDALHAALDVVAGRSSLSRRAGRAAS